MAVLKEETHSNLSIAAFAAILAYTNTTDRELVVICKTEIGSMARPIAGNGSYQLKATLDGVEILPNAAVVVTTQPYVVMESRYISLEVGQTLSISIRGQVTDTGVDTEAVLADVTPAMATDLTGTGSTPLDHDYGGTDELRAVDPDGAGVQDVTITAFLASDYEAGNRTASYVRGRTTTNVSGRWRSPISLDPGDYTLIFAKPSAFTTGQRDVTVA